MMIAWFDIVDLFNLKDSWRWRLIPVLGQRFSPRQGITGQNKLLAFNHCLMGRYCIGVLAYWRKAGEFSSVNLIGEHASPVYY